MEFSLSQGTFAFQSLNVGDTEIKGIDISIGGQGEIKGAEISLIGGYTYIDPKYVEFDPAGNNGGPNVYDPATETGLFNAATSSSDENILKYRFRHTFKLDAQVSIKKFTFGGSYSYNSFMEAVDALFELPVPIQGLKDYREENNQGISVLDLRLGYNFTKNIKLSVLAKNVLNNEYIRRPAYIEAPRSFTARVDFEF